MNNKIIICSGATENYMKYMINLYESLRLFHKNIYFEANIIIDKDNEYNNKLIKKFNKYNDKYLIIKIDKKKFDNNDHKRNYSSNFRINSLYNNLEKYDMIFWMDADTLIKKPLVQLFNIDNKYKILIYNHKIDKDLNSYGSTEQPFKQQFKSGIIGFRNHEISLYLLKNWLKIINLFDDNYWCWFEDQLMIGYIMKKVFTPFNI